MHELSIALEIRDIVHRAFPSDARRVERVHVRVGELAGVVPDSLSFSFDAVTAGTVLEGAVLEIERVPFRLHCEECGNAFIGQNGVGLCTTCGGSRTIVVSGMELQVTAIEVEDGPVSQVRSAGRGDRPTEAT